MRVQVSLRPFATVDPAGLSGFHVNVLRVPIQPHQTNVALLQTYGECVGGIMHGHGFVSFQSQAQTAKLLILEGHFVLARSDARPVSNFKCFGRKNFRGKHMPLPHLSERTDDRQSNNQASADHGNSPDS
jgi:hypothetical protein